MKDKGKIIFLGNNEKTLKTLLECNVQIEAAIHEIDHDLPHAGTYDEAVKTQGGRVIAIPKDNKNALLSVLKGFERPDLFVVSIFTILSREALAFPAIGCVNVHPSLLPDYRGPHPVQWALINGEKQTGITFMDLDPGVDRGGIYKKIAIDILYNDDSLTVFDKMNQAVSKHLCEVLTGILKKTLAPVPQEGYGSYFPKLNAFARYINFRKMTASDVHNLTRSQVKYGGAMTTFKGKRIEFYKSCIVEEDSSTSHAGEILNVSHNSKSECIVTVQCVSGKIELYGSDPVIRDLKTNDVLGS